MRERICERKKRGKGKKKESGWRKKDYMKKEERHKLKLSLVRGIFIKALFSQNFSYIHTDGHFR